MDRYERAANVVGLARRGSLRLAMVAVLTATVLVIPTQARAASSCGTSSGHTICVSVASNTLSGEASVTITNTPNTGDVIVTWVPSNGPVTTLIQMSSPSPETGDYSFVWPTEKYLDRAGTLQLREGSKRASSVDLNVSLNNGNTTDFQRSPSDWATFVPGTWNGSNDPTIVAVGDGPSDETASNAVADRIAAIDPPLFLFLGDVYETGSFTEFRDHYGASALDSPGAGTLWGRTADVTQPTLGNHENANKDAFIDYWHGRPLFSTFTFAGVLFLDLNSSASMSATSAQYQMVQSAITSPTAPACIVAFWHKPAVVSNTSVADAERAIWTLLANNGADLLLSGHQHHMVEFKPLDAGFNAGTSGSHLVELVSGAGGHSLPGVSKTPPGVRIAWSKGGTAGLVALTLDGAGGGKPAVSLGWQFQDVNGTALRSGAVTCS
jgi:hypothetical protein